jgi:hypothetical protein
VHRGCRLHLSGHAEAAPWFSKRGAPEGAVFVEGPVEALIGEHLPADLVILNPPRAGIAAEAADALVAAPAKRIIYVSCNPATLARDLKRMSAAYRLESIRSFDLFPRRRTWRARRCWCARARSGIDPPAKRRAAGCIHPAARRASGPGRIRLSGSSVLDDRPAVVAVGIHHRIPIAVA